MNESETLRHMKAVDHGLPPCFEKAKEATWAQVHLLTHRGLKWHPERGEPHSLLSNQGA